MVEFPKGPKNDNQYKDVVAVDPSLYAHTLPNYKKEKDQLAPIYTLFVSPMSFDFVVGTRGGLIYRFEVDQSTNQIKSKKIYANGHR